MMLKHLSITLLLASIAWTGCKKDDDTDDPTPTLEARAILPGAGIKEVRIGDEAQVAIDLFGLPFPSYGAANGIYTHFLVYVSKGVVVYCEPTTESTFNPQMKIASLKLSDPFPGKTEKGIGIGSTKAAVKAAYGDPTSSNPTFGDKYDIGITFIYDGSDLVKDISVE